MRRTRNVVSLWKYLKAASPCYPVFSPSYTYSFYIGFTTALPKHFKYIISTAFFWGTSHFVCPCTPWTWNCSRNRVWPVFLKRNPQLFHWFPLEHHQGAAEHCLQRLSPIDPGTCFGTHGKYKAMLEIKLQQI